MDDKDALAMLLVKSTSTREKVIGIFFCIGSILVLLGLFTLAVSQSPLKYTPSTLPPFPSGKRLQSIIDTQASSSAQEKIFINTASLDQLDVLPGIGVVRAQKIIQMRPYRDYQDLLKRSGVSESVLAPSRSRLQF